MNEDDYIGRQFLTCITDWWIDPVYFEKKNWSDLIGCEAHATRAECIGVMQYTNRTFLILQSCTGISKGYYCWKQPWEIKEIPPLTLLAEAAE